MSPIMILKLTKNTDPIWNQKFKNIKSVTPEIKRLISDMEETIDITSAVGLAAPQVGIPLRLFVIRYRKLKEAFINPKIISKSKEFHEYEEGCLSVPCSRGALNRANTVEIEYLDLKGRKKRAKLSGYYARISQHEYDHLSSTFYINRISDKNKLYTYKPIKIVFFGTSEYGALILKSLIGQKIVGEYEISLVVTPPDKPAGRGKELKPSAVKNLANQFNLAVDTPNSLKNNPGFVSKLKKMKPDFLVLASYGKIIPKVILEIPTKYPLNIHPSLLPKYRGASPISAAIQNGDTYTGGTVMVMNEKMDEGDLLAISRLKIGSKDTREALEGKLARLGANMINQVLHLTTINQLKPRSQNHNAATYTKPLEKEDGLINWEKPPENIERMIRAYYPWPGVWTRYNGKILKLLPNKMVQVEGKEPVKLEEFKQGHKDFTLNW